MSNETFGYTMRVAKGYVLLVLCAVVAAGAGWLAVTNKAGLTIAGYEFGPFGATAIYALVAAVAMMVTVEELRGLLRPAMRRAEIRLDDTGIIAPADPANPRLMHLTYKGISDIKAALRDGERVLVIRHIEGNLRISASAMENREAFERLWRSLESRVGLHRGYRY